MELMVESLYDRIKDKISLTPLAGSDGFYRMVRWIQQDERASNLHLLRSGDLVISTEHTDVSTDELLDYIRSLNDMNASGLILYAHVTDSEDHMIAPEVEELCRELQFPLLCVPESIHIGDITREACSALFDFDHAYDTVNDILSGLLYDPHMSSRNEEYIVRFGFPLDADYVILAFRDDEKVFFQSANDDNYKYLNRFFYTLGEKFFYFREAGYGVILLQDVPYGRAYAYAKKIVKDLSEIHHSRTLRCGVGTIVSNLTNIKLSFRNARAAVSYAKFKDSKCISFDEMGFYKMLFSSEDQKILREYTTCLEPILSYDRKHNSKLVKTLAVYLKSGRSIQRVASELSCHRNTINYRMGRIEELLYLDINDYENAFILELAFRVLEYLQQLKLEDLIHE